MENLGHLAGMLDRDQRTAKLRFFSDKQVAKTHSIQENIVNESNANPNSIISHHRFYCPTRTKSSNSSYLTWKSGYLLKFFHRLTNVLIVGVYLTLVTFPSTSSAPANIKMSERMKETPKWINPCGISQFDNEEDNGPGVSDAELLERIVTQSNIALTNAKKFRDRFAQTTFGMSFDKVHELFLNQPTWLNMNLPKGLEEEIPQETLDTLKIDDALLDAYGFLQMVAVGLEQVVWDQEDNQGAFAKEFADTEQQLRNVLCELQMTIIERKIKMRPDVERSVMSDEERHLNITQTKARDWRIFREYMNTLEYISKAFSHLIKCIK